jgi:glycosyltransferase involved in cell wall biosynthesis
MQLWHRERQSRVETLRAERDGLLRQVGELNAQLETRERSIAQFKEELFGSTIWKVLQRLIAFRVRFLPPHSLPDRFIKKAFRSLTILRSGGIKAFAKALAPGLVGSLRKNQRVSTGALANPQGVLEGKVLDGRKLIFPAISLLLIRNSPESTTDESKLRLWLQGQTLPQAAEIVIWDRGTGEVTFPGSSAPTLSAPDLPSLCEKLNGRYLCMVSPDLLQQNESYLEANLAALATEALAFTVNFTGQATWAVELVAKGCLPGNSEHPLLRMLVEKTCLRDEFTCDPSVFIQRSGESPKAFGKIILHQSKEIDAQGSLPFEGKLPDLGWTFVGKRLVARAGKELAVGADIQVVHPVETVLPIVEDKSNLPTVLLVQQFLAVGGAEQLALNIIGALKDQIRFIVVPIDATPPELGTTADAYRKLTPYVYIMPDFLSPDLRESFLAYLIERFRPVTLYIHNGCSYIYDVLPALKKRFPRLRTVNQVYDHQIGWINRYDVSLVLNLDAHIGANRKICQAYLEQGARPEKVFQVEHGIETQKLDPGLYNEKMIAEVKNRLDLPINKKIVTFASRLHPQKRPMDFVELARRYTSDPGVFFLMVGDGPLAGVVDGNISRLHLTNIRRRPFYRPIGDILAVTDVLVLPSEYEGMPLIVSEAQCMGKPVVVTDAGNNREVLEITGGGVLVASQGDLGALVDGVRAMLDSPPDPLTVRRALLEHYGMDVIAEKYKDVLLGRPLA